MTVNINIWLLFLEWKNYINSIKYKRLNDFIGISILIGHTIKLYKPPFLSDQYVLH